MGVPDNVEDCLSQNRRVVFGRVPKGGPVPIVQLTDRCVATEKTLEGTGGRSWMGQCAMGRRQSFRAVCGAVQRLSEF